MILNLTPLLNTIAQEKFKFYDINSLSKKLIQLIISAKNKLFKNQE
tara:strand:+ start:334 stop:471 length:138 start_codon:yes stop_codon:yes gene_type:complete